MDLSQTRRSRSLSSRSVLAFVLFVSTGCGPRSAFEALDRIVWGEIDDTPLRIATPWPQTDRLRLSAEFTAWLAREREGSLPAPGTPVWIPLAEADPLESALTRFRPADVILGGPVVSYERLQEEGRLEGFSAGEGPAWIVARESALQGPRTDESREVGGAVDEFRTHPRMFAWARGHLRQASWKNGYAQLVRFYGQVDPEAGPRPVDWKEGAAILRGARHPREARSFLEFLAETQGARLGRSAGQVELDVAGLEADLLDSTLVDARDELLRAWQALHRGAGNAPSALAWMLEPPPWPPASIEKLQARGGEAALAMVDDLAAQIAPDPELRLALGQSWARPSRPIDGSVLAELARAAGGRLVREPRFRAWLGAEWRAWARQRYRRVARLTESGRDVAPAPSKSR